jgi:ATP-binding cassette subfamily A (ABC1) protein 3
MPMPTPEYNVNLFFASAHLMAIVIAMGFLDPMSQLVKSIVEEKELRTEETLFIHGVKPWAYISSLMIVAYMFFFIASVFLSLTIHFNIMVSLSLGYIFALVVLFGSATVGFSFFIASFFSKSKIASLVGPMALFTKLSPTSCSSRPTEMSIYWLKCFRPCSLLRHFFLGLKYLQHSSWQKLACIPGMYHKEVILLIQPWNF